MNDRAPVRVHIHGTRHVVRVVPVMVYRLLPAGSGPDAGTAPPELAWRADFSGRRYTAATPLEAARRAVGA